MGSQNLIPKHFALLLNSISSTHHDFRGSWEKREKATITSAKMLILCFFRLNIAIEHKIQVEVCGQVFIVGGGRGFHRNNTRELRRVVLNSCLCQKLLFSLTRCLNSKISRRNYIIPKISSGSKMPHFSICFFFFFHFSISTKKNFIVSKQKESECTMFLLQKKYEQNFSASKEKLSR